MEANNEYIVYLKLDKWLYCVKRIEVASVVLSSVVILAELLRKCGVF